MRRNIRHILPLLLVALTLVTALAGKKSGSRPVSRQDAAKSRYFYLEGLRQNLLDNPDAAYECEKRAVALNPANDEAKLLLGTLRQYVRNPQALDSTGAARPLELMRGYVDKYPDDVFEGIQYAVIASMQDSVGEAVRALEHIRRSNPDNASVLAYLSQAYAQLGETGKAVAALDHYEEVEGRSPGLTLQKMSLLLAGSDTVGAMREVDQLIESNPKSYTFRILKGNLYEVMQQLDSAENQYLEAQKMAPESSEPKVALMDIYQLRGDSTAYNDMLYNVLLTDDLDIEQKTRLLGEYLQTVIDSKADTQHGDYLFSVLEKQYPHEPEVMDLAARYSAAKHDFSSAADQIQYAVDMDPKNSGLWQQLIFYLANADRMDEAIAAYHRADSLSAMTDELRLYGGLLLMNRKEYGKAMDLYADVIHKIAPGLNIKGKVKLSELPRDITVDKLDFLSNALTSMGDCAYVMKDTTVAFNCYGNALELNPDNAMAANNYAYFLCESGGDLNRALELSQESLRGENADNYTFLDTYAWILYKLGRYKEALEQQKRTIEQLTENNQTDVEAVDHYGDILLKNDFPAEALRYWNEALKLQPDREGMKEKIETVENNLKKK